MRLVTGGLGRVCWEGWAPVSSLEEEVGGAEGGREVGEGGRAGGASPGYSQPGDTSIYA